MATDKMTVQVSLAEAGGLLGYIEHKWYQLQEELGGSISDGTRARMDELVALLDLHSELSDAALHMPDDGSRTITAKRDFLEPLIREGGEYGREVLGSALSGDYGDHKANRTRAFEGKGMMTLAEREGLYEGVMV